MSAAELCDDMSRPDRYGTPHKCNLKRGHRAKRHQWRDDGRCYMSWPVTAEPTEGKSS